MHVATRHVHFAGCTTNPHTVWVKQAGREETNSEDGFLNGRRYLIMDRDSKFCDSFRATLEDEGVKCGQPPSRSPKMNPHLERLFGSLKAETLDRMIFFGE